MAARVLADEPEWSASERIREDRCYEKYLFTYVTCKM